MKQLVACVAVILVAGFLWADKPLTRTDPGFVGRPAPPDMMVGTDDCPGLNIGTVLPYTDPGDTCGFTNSITTYAGTCTLPYPYGGEDVIYEMNLGGGNTVAFSADLTGSTGDLALFLLSTCGDGNSCVANSQDAIGPGVGPEEILSASYPVGAYYLYVDSYYDAGTAGSCGTYTLTITGTLPAELIEFSAE